MSYQTLRDASNKLELLEKTIPYRKQFVKGFFDQIWMHNTIRFILIFMKIYLTI
jgi:hypothetical protein